MRSIPHMRYLCQSWNTIWNEMSSDGAQMYEFPKLKHRVLTKESNGANINLIKTEVEVALLKSSVRDAGGAGERM